MLRPFGGRGRILRKHELRFCPIFDCGLLGLLGVGSGLLGVGPGLLELSFEKLRPVVRFERLVATGGPDLGLGFGGDERPDAALCSFGDAQLDLGMDLGIGRRRLCGEARLFSEEALAR